MKLIFSLAILTALSGCANTEPWTKRDTIMQATLYTVMAADAYSTRNIQYDPYVEEVSPITRSILGPQPKTSETWQYFVTWGVVHYLAVRAMPAKWRPWYQSYFIIGHASLVINNAELGLFNRKEPKYDFPWLPVGPRQ